MREAGLRHREVQIGPKDLVGCFVELETTQTALAVGHRLLEGGAADGRPRGSKRVAGAVGATPNRGGREEVMRERGLNAGIAASESFECVTHTRMHFGAGRRGLMRHQHLAHEIMGELEDLVRPPADDPGA